jgi:dTDP-4-amino-4,6-dideoxygalactose transaminase
MHIPFNRPFLTGKEQTYIAQALAGGHLSGDGPFTKKCNAWLEHEIGCHKALLTHSCTAALEMAAILADIQSGDEVIMPAYTFVSTANAFVLRGAVPVFVDIRPDTLNLDERKIEAAITPRTKAVAPVHYAGVGCEMDAIMAIARAHGLLVIEDAAQAIMADYKGKPLGSFGQLAALSFHETKNIVSGEGGALLINDPALAARAEVIREKGTNRSQFFRGQVDKYTWVDIGSSYLPSELIAAFLYAQFEQAQEITRARLRIWQSYYAGFERLEAAGAVQRPLLHSDGKPNAHMFYLLFSDLATRTAVVQKLKDQAISAVFHYVPLHSAPAGKVFGRYQADLPITTSVADRLLRLPLWLGIEPHLQRIIESVEAAVRR